MMQAPLQPVDFVAGGKHMSVEIGGRDRFKFFKRPLVPAMAPGATLVGAAAAGGVINVNRPIIQRALQPRQQVMQDVRGAQAAPRPPRTLDKLTASFNGSKGGRHPNNVGAESAAPRNPADAHASAGDLSASSAGAAGGSTRDTGCQTLYRENDCQTDPYTPDYFVEEGQQPEVLAIMELRYGEGLPAALGEVEMIDRVQRRKKVEASLPQGSDPKSMQRRLEALEALERTEWDEREAHIKQLQEERVRQVESALHRREERREEQSRLRVDAIRQQKLTEAELKLQKLQEKRLTITRKLTSQHANPCCERETRDIIQAHVLYGAKGRSVRTTSLIEKVNTNNYDVRPTLLSFPEGVQELEKTKVPVIETIPSKRMVPDAQPAIQLLETNYRKRQAKRVVDDLEYAHNVIEASHETKEKAASIQDLYRATPRLQRPDTPTLVLQGDDEEEREEAVLLLQRLLRGRAVQNDFFEGKERCHGLIEELQAASNAKDAEFSWIPDKEREVFQSKQEAMVQSVIDGVVGDVVFGTLDYLHKELLRQQEAAKVDQLRLWAMATRRDRETAEAERRAQEQASRRKEEEQYAHLVASIDATVSSYLDQLLAGTAAAAAAEQAQQEFWQKRRAVVEPATEVDKEAYVCEVLDTFVIPQAVGAAAPGANARAQALSEASIAAADAVAVAASTRKA